MWHLGSATGKGQPTWGKHLVGAIEVEMGCQTSVSTRCVFRLWIDTFCIFFPYFCHVAVSLSLKRSQATLRMRSYNAVVWRMLWLRKCGRQVTVEQPPTTCSGQSWKRKESEYDYHHTIIQYPEKSPQLDKSNLSNHSENHSTSINGIITSYNHV